MFGLSAIALPTFTGFSALFYSGLAASYPSIVYPCFFIAEETLVTLLMLVYCQVWRAFDANG